VTQGYTVLNARMYNGQCTTECPVQSQASACGTFGIEINSGKNY